MGTRHLLLLLLVYLDPLNVLCAAAATTTRKPPKDAPLPRRPQSTREDRGPSASSTALPLSVVPRRLTQLPAPSVLGALHETCLGYYDVSGQYDKEFACNNTDHRYCCGSCFLRFCCADKVKRLEQRTCTNYNTPEWIKTQPPSPAPTGDTYDPELDRTNTTVYITCGVITFIIFLGISAKVAYDKATKPPQEMNVHRALADILRQQGPVNTPIAQYDDDDNAAIDGSPQKENTPVRSSKNQYTPVHGKTSNHGHYAKDGLRPGGGQDMHGFLTLGRAHLKAQHSVDDLGQLSWQGSVDVPLSYSNHQHDFQHSHLDLTALTPKLAHRNMRYDNQRMNNILTSQTEPYDLSFSRSIQNLTHLHPSYDPPGSRDLGDKDMDEYYTRKRSHLPLPDLTSRGAPTHLDLPSRGPPTHLVKLSSEPHQQQQNPPQRQQRPRRVQRAMSQDHVLSPERAPHPPPKPAGGHRGGYGLSSYPAGPGGGGGGGAHYGSSRMLLSEEQLLCADRLRSQDPLLSPDKMLSLRRSNFREKAMARAMSHADVFSSGPPATPVLDRYAKMQKMHSHPSASGGGGGGGGAGEPYANTLTVNQAPSTSKRQAFASRRTHTVDHLQYIPGHHQNHQNHQYRTASKNEVTV